MAVKLNARDRRRAIKIYRDFREENPKSLAVFAIDVPAAVASIGHVEAIDYRTTHGKKVALYRHAFAAGSRPLLCVSADGRQLLLLGGRFKFTERGIVDRDARGREIENAKHGRAINPKKAPGDMTAGEINKALDRLDAADSKLTTAMIDAGRGHELPTETLKKSDPLARKKRSNYEARMTLLHEIERRYGPGAPSRLPLRR